MSNRPRNWRYQQLLDRLTAILPSRLISRARTNDSGHGQPVIERRVSRTGTGRIPDSDGPPTEPTPAPPAAAVANTAVAVTAAAPVEEADPDAPVRLLLPGMSELTMDTVRGLAPAQLCNLPVADGPAFVPKPPHQPDLLLTMLPIEIHLAIFDAPQLSLYDLLALRNTCHALRATVPIGAVERRLTAQNYAGWRVVFEMNGHKYPGTTYGNRRLCGRCVVPKTRAHLIDGADVRAYLARRGVGGGDDGITKESDVWPEERGMCFPCLRVILSAAATRPESDKEPVGKDVTSDAKGAEKTGQAGDGDKSADDEIYRRAGISPRDMFKMMDGTTRKTCDRCARDIHENAVPCPHCTNFSEWCRTRHR